ncbi:PAS domain-containing protein [Aliifodinibius salicampi]|uniref:PAS domain-containing protein n=1 Tax=Fodinibius salicampi TaxID=1920655 RepID=A0ABT3PX83_9BACT|nr:PAS domain-containing protein [Fodinibius salicampi]MCW9712463.1 PAS domain-containing protein [Fodinibius salicampi]
MPGVLFVLNEQGEVIKWNAHSTDVFGLTDGEISRQPAEAFVHDDDKELIRESIANVFEEGHARVELKLYTAGDNTAIYDFIANKFQQHDQTYIVGSGVDVTKQKNLEKKCKLRCMKNTRSACKQKQVGTSLKRCLKKPPTPKCLLEGSEMRFVIANKAYREVVGQDNVIGKRVIEVNTRSPTTGIH